MKVQCMSKHLHPATRGTSDAVCFNGNGIDVNIIA